ncbi:hypothetical protein HDU98_009868 [Podochytrium sp. JEL0797]|nr:hypothetical protein HDU98_009868 [Podochytrium sp. JEL0797]
MPLPPVGPKYTWAGWANQQSYTAGFFTVCGGILTLVFYPKLPGNILAVPVGIATVVLGLITMALEHPAPYIHNLGFAYTNYYPRVAFYSLVTVVSMLQCPTQTSGLCFLCAVITYARAAYCGETCAIPRGKKK